MRIGVDTGGTFTDFVIFRDDGSIETFKLRSDPRSPARVILQGLLRAGATQATEVVHGSTVATNALLERKGARTALVTTAGFEDLVHIGRQNRERLYDLTPAPRRPLVPPELCFGVSERTLFDGTVEREPVASEIELLKKRLRRARASSVALCFLHSYQNPANERVVVDLLQSGFLVSSSHEICPEFREYERASTTIVNAYVRPLMESYLCELQSAHPGPLFILQSNGGSLSAAEASRQAVRTVLSGPAGGVGGAIEMARRSGFSKVLGFDMGGTSTDVSLADGRAHETMEAFIDGLPVRAPMLDIHTVGAGGGSLAWVDEGGLLRVGPESAGADPGPACYGIGEQATVTDAHVVLGRITAGQFLAGEMLIDGERADMAVDRLASALSTDRETAAEGILRVANAKMQRAIRVVSVERGHDPRQFVLAAFGGCGGLHACEIAEELGIEAVLVPRYAGCLSALGMLLADRIRDYAAGVLHRDDIEVRFRELEDRALAETPGAAVERYADIRYAGQSYELTVPWNASDPAVPFHIAHEKTYGYKDDGRRVELVAIRVRARLVMPDQEFPRERHRDKERAQSRRVRVQGRWRRLPVLSRHEVPAKAIPGPLLVLDYGSTALIPPGWRIRLDRAGNLVATRGRAPSRRANLSSYEATASLVK